jgi:hypothetical protein
MICMLKMNLLPQSTSRPGGIPDGMYAKRNYVGSETGLEDMIVLLI